MEVTTHVSASRFLCYQKFFDADVHCSEFSHNAAGVKKVVDRLGNWTADWTGACHATRRIDKFPSPTGGSRIQSVFEDPLLLGGKDPRVFLSHYGFIS